METESQAGVAAFIRGVSELAWRAYLEQSGDRRLVNTVAERYAFIRLPDAVHPIRFLRQMAGAPPIQVGTEGFRADILDDYNPARHYSALLFVGFYAPRFLATLILFAWEIAGFVRYRGQWSWPDIRSGLLGIRHGRLVRRYGGVVLPALIASQVAEKVDDWESPACPNQPAGGHASTDGYGAALSSGSDSVTACAA